MKQSAPTDDEATTKWEAKRQPRMEIGTADRSMAQRLTARGAKATDQGGQGRPQAGTAQAGSRQVRNRPERRAFVPYPQWGAGSPPGASWGSCRIPTCGWAERLSALPDAGGRASDPAGVPFPGQVRAAPCPLVLERCTHSEPDSTDPDVQGLWEEEHRQAGASEEEDTPAIHQRDNLYCIEKSGRSHEVVCSKGPPTPGRTG